MTSGAFRPPSKSPGPTTTTCDSAPRSGTACSVCAKFSRMTIVSAPLSSSWRCNSSAL
ncbi:Uncharacterised protein [Bordetella pertussis]|nr:Uncharacterised protein [Bordetella pertussis]CFW43122.1 Uncharacterised protein [Bordetella pertussis]